MASTTLQHPLHEHALTKRELRELSSSECGICSLQVRGAAYGCDPCSYILHEPCASEEVPPQMAKHPIDPEHPLEEKIHHISHHHSLDAIDSKVPNWIRCGMCREPIPGSAYGCWICNFFLHESCARLPLKIIQHPSHPSHPLTLSFSEVEVVCNSCDCFKSKTWAYRCEECNLHIDSMCAALLLSLQEQEKEDRVTVGHFSHEHQLSSGHVEESEQTNLCCAACDVKISGEVYYCLGCSFFLHKLCADELLHNMVHYLHPEHPLVVLPKPPYSSGYFRCSCCKLQHSSMVFHCASCDFDLDPKCALQTSSAVRDGIATEIQFFGHHHPLVLHCSRYFLCKVCREHNSGLAYCCESCDEYNLHKSCGELPLQLEHPLHSHPLSLVPESHPCDNCGTRFRGFNYHCPECAFDLCFKCAIERPTLKHHLHEHALSLFEKVPDKGTALCNSCGKVGSTDIYCCRRCNFSLHPGCASLPPTIQHEWHPYHPLVLFDRFVEGLPQYQYCDMCEELRNPEHGVYRCAREECWHTVHIECVLPQAQVTKYESSYLHKLKKKIKSLEETIETMKTDLDAAEKELTKLKGEERDELSKQEEED